MSEKGQTLGVEWGVQASCAEAVRDPPGAAGRASLRLVLSTSRVPKGNGQSPHISFPVFLTEPQLRTDGAREPSSPSHSTART